MEVTQMRVIQIRWIAVGLVAVLGFLAVACSDDGSDADRPVTATVGNTAALEPDPAATGVPLTETVAQITDGELVAIAEALFPAVGNVAFAACDNYVDGACPITPRLEARVADPNVPLCRCQNGSGSREIEALPERFEDGGGIVRVTMWEGTTSFDVVVVKAGGEWLVDDHYCAGKPETSIYEYAGPC
jgi:hypothetical protein